MKLKLQVLFLFLFASACDARPAFETRQAVLEVGDTRHILTLEVAITEAQQTHGLMFRKDLPPRHGMIFIHNPPRVAQMWMKNTPLPLDMLFLDATGRVVDLHYNARPFDETVITSKVAVSAVVEVNAGTLSALGVAPETSRIVWVE